MVKRTRRTMHRVWCDMLDFGIKYSSKDIDYVWYEEKIYKLSNTSKGEFLLTTPNNKDVVHMDVDTLYENCYEVFDDEVKALRVLYG